MLLLSNGRPDAWYLRRRARKQAEDWRAALHQVAPWVEDASTEDPIFILACGWRSGSTVLQRIIASSKQAIIWGEPYADSGIIPSLARQILPFSRSWPQQRWILSDQPTGLGLARLHSENLYPRPSALVAAHRTFLDTLLAEPARQLGYSRWGFKEVRLTAEYAAYLKLLYPRARLVFLVRNPLNSWASYRSEARWFIEWPDRQVRTVFQFGQAWARIARSFLAWQETLDALLVRYEDLTHDGRAIASLREHLGISLEPESALKYHTSSTMSFPSQYEVNALRLMVARSAAALGYQV
jgi:hypothetical protein